MSLVRACSGREPDFQIRKVIFMAVLGVLLIVSGMALLFAAVNVGRQHASFAENPYETGGINEKREQEEKDCVQEAEDEKLAQSETLALSGFCRILKIAGIVLCAIGLLGLIAGLL